MELWEIFVFSFVIFVFFNFLIINIHYVLMRKYIIIKNPPSMVILEKSWLLSPVAACKSE